MKPRMRPLYSGLWPGFWMCYGNHITVIDITPELAFETWVNCIMHAAAIRYDQPLIAPKHEELQ